MARLFLIVSTLFLLTGVSSAYCAQIPEIVQSDICVDPTMELRIEDVDRPDFSARFVPVSFPASLGKDQSAYWLRLRIYFPPESKNENWVFDWNWNFLRSLTWYAPELSPLAFYASGDWNAYVDAATLLPRAQGDEVVLYVRIVGYGGVNLNPKIIPESVKLRNGQLRDRMLWGFFGILFAMFVYNAFIYFSLNDVSYLWYSLHIAFSSWYYLFTNGLAPHIGEGPKALVFHYDVKIFTITAALMFLSITLFTRSFLETKGRHPALDKVLVALTWFCSVNVVLSIVAESSPAMAVGPVVGVVTSFTVLACGLTRLFQGYKPAAVFVPGWLVYMAFGFVHSLTWLGVFPANAFTLYAPEFGASIEVLVMSLALAYRVRMLQEEKSAAESENNRLAEKSALFSILLDHSTLGIGLVREGAFSWANRQLEAMLGKNNHLEGALLSETPGFEKLLGQPDSGDFADSLAREGSVVIGGADKDIRALGRAVKPGAAQTGTVWVVEDITERKRLERFKESIDQIARHDLKSPLAAIRGLQGVVEESGPLNESQRRALDLIGQSANQGMRSLAAALALYRIENGMFDPAASSANMLVVLSGAVNELTPLAEKDGKKIHVNARGNLGSSRPVRGDKDLIHTVFVNLLKNALEAVPDKGEVRVDIEDAEGLMRVHIGNKGGIPVEIQGRFFEKFTTMGKKRGTGLGAYSARSIARALGGEVELDLSTPGWVSLRVTLPKAQPSAT